MYSKLLGLSISDNFVNSVAMSRAYNESNNTIVLQAPCRDYKNYNLTYNLSLALNVTPDRLATRSPQIQGAQIVHVASEGLLTYEYNLSDKTELKNIALWLLAIRLLTLVLLVVLLTVHVSSLKVFRWEQSVSGGIIGTYIVVVLGLALAIGAGSMEVVLPSFFSLTGGTIFVINALVLLIRWRTAGELTLAVAELLVSLGLQVKEQITLKAVLSLLVAVFMFTDVAVLNLMRKTPSWL